VKRDFGGQRLASTPQARNKQRIAGAFIAVAAALDLAGTLVGTSGAHRALTMTLFGVATVLMLAGVVYILTNRKAV
jgi:hypothetical protein